MQGEMMNGSMMLCMAATSRFVLILAVTVIIQAVLQSKILSEPTGMEAEANATRVAGSSTSQLFILTAQESPGRTSDRVWAGR